MNRFLASARTELEEAPTPESRSGAAAVELPASSTESFTRSGRVAARPGAGQGLTGRAGAGPQGWVERAGDGAGGAPAGDRQGPGDAWAGRLSFLVVRGTRVLDALGFQDVQITQATRDGGADARVVYQRGVVGARAIVSAKRWTARTVPVDEVRMMRGVKGEEDTAIIVTTGRFSADAQNEARPGQNQRVVYLIDGEKLVDVCKRYQIGAGHRSAIGRPPRT